MELSSLYRLMVGEYSLTVFKRCYAFECNPEVVGVRETGRVVEELNILSKYTRFRR